jgi:hypothetical protein
VMTLLLFCLFPETRWPSRDPHCSATADLLPVHSSSNDNKTNW